MNVVGLIKENAIGKWFHLHIKKISQIPKLLDIEFMAKFCDWSCDKPVIVSSNKNVINAYKEENSYFVFLENGEWWVCLIAIKTKLK